MHGTIEPITYHAAGTQKKLEMVNRDCFTVAPFDGHYEPLLECGTPVKKGDTVGLLHDFDYIDMEPWPVKAGVDGAVLAQAWVASVPRGQYIVVGKIIDCCSVNHLRPFVPDLLVRFDDNEYSVSVQYTHRNVTFVATVHEVRFVFDDRVIARHRRWLSPLTSNC